MRNRFIIYSPDSKDIFIFAKYLFLHLFFSFGRKDNEKYVNETFTCKNTTGKRMNSIHMYIIIFKVEDDSAAIFFF